jgi:peptidoglycan/LPS O-acetylase OafA/YrhL
MDRAISRHHALDLLRGLAAIGIAVYHFLSLTFDITVQSLGTFGVYVFFILSGSTMILVYGTEFSRTVVAENVKLFYWNRISRIIPLLAAVSLVGLLLAVPEIGINRHLVARAVQSLMTGSGLFALHLPGYLSTAMGAWSLGIELIFYVLFPVVCLLAAGVRLRNLVAVMVVLVIAQHIVIQLISHWLRDDPTRFWHYYTTPLIFAPYFLLGIMIPRIPLRKRHVHLLASVACLGVIAGFSLLVNVPIFETHWAYLTLTAVSFAAVLFAYHALPPGYLIAPATFLGNVSYSLYLTHPFSWQISQAMSVSMGFGPVAKLVLFLSLALAIAYGSFMLFERPARQFLRASIRDRAIGVPSV